MSMNFSAESPWLLSRGWRQVSIAFAVAAAYFTIAKFALLSFETFVLDASHCPDLGRLAEGGALRQGLADFGLAVAAVCCTGSYFLYVAKLRQTSSAAAIHFSWVIASLAAAGALYWFDLYTCDLLALPNLEGVGIVTRFWYRANAYFVATAVAFMYAREGYIVFALLAWAFAVHSCAVLLVPWLGVLLCQFGLYYCRGPVARKTQA
jgi:hypothetical protein